MEEELCSQVKEVEVDSLEGVDEEVLLEGEEELAESLETAEVVEDSAGGFVELEEGSVPSLHAAKRSAEERRNTMRFVFIKTSTFLRLHYKRG